MTRDLMVDNLAYRSGTVLMFPAAREDLLRRVRDGAPADAFELHWICGTGGLGFRKAMPIVLRDEETLRQALACVG